MGSKGAPSHFLTVTTTKPWEGTSWGYGILGVCLAAREAFNIVSPFISFLSLFCNLVLVDDLCFGLNLSDSDCTVVEKHVMRFRTKLQLRKTRISSSLFCSTLQMEESASKANCGRIFLFVQLSFDSNGALTPFHPIKMWAPDSFHLFLELPQELYGEV